MSAADSTTIQMRVERRVWPRREPFVLSRETITENDNLVVTLVDREGRRGRGEACGLPYLGETRAQLGAQLEAVGAEVEAGMDRSRLQRLLPPGGARAALDAALWDLEAKQTGRTVFELAGIEAPRPVETAYTIGIRPTEDVRAAAAARAGFHWLKLKVDARDPLAAVAAARAGAPRAALIVDPNQAWSVDDLKALAPRMREMGAALLEQPIPVGAEAGLDGWTSPVPLCADELVNGADDLANARGRFQVVNIKLDKSGGLTAGLELAQAAKAQGFGLMVGCMGGSSLAIAPAAVLAQLCAFVDLDAPLHQTEDWQDGLIYEDGRLQPPSPRFWG